MGCRQPLQGPGICACNQRDEPLDLPLPPVPTLEQLRAMRAGDLNVTLAEDGRTVVAATLAGDAIPRALGQALAEHAERVPRP